MKKIHPEWKPLIAHLFKDLRWKKMQKIISKTEFYPRAEDIFSALSISPNDVKAVIIGMSPEKTKSYVGYAFGTDGRNTNSLRVIHDALWYQYNDITVDKDSFDNTMQTWVNQGVLLLNASLTVPKVGARNAHVKYWKWFMTGLLASIAHKNIPTARVGYAARQLEVGHTRVINTCHPLKTYTEFYKKSCNYNRLDYNDNFLKHRMFLWFDKKNCNIKWIN